MGYTEPIDYNELMQAFLKSLTSLTTATSGRIYGPGGLPIDWVPTLGKTIVWTESPGAADIEIPIFKPMYQIRCYDLKPPGSRALALLVIRAIHRRNKVRLAITGGFGLVQYGRLMGTPFNMTEPETEWNLDMLSVQMHFSENLVP